MAYQAIKIGEKPGGAIWRVVDDAGVESLSVARLDMSADDVLADHLVAIGLVSPPPQQSDYAAAIQNHVDATAASRSYADGVSLASYVSSTIPGWSAEAQAFVAWRDAIWIHAHTELARVLAGEREQPTISELIAELPAMVWPA